MLTALLLCAGLAACGLASPNNSADEPPAASTKGSQNAGNPAGKLQNNTIIRSDMDALVELHIENGEGIGEMTVFAADSDNIRYDLRIPAKFMDLCSGSWVAAISDQPGGNSGYYCALYFSEDGSLIFQKGWIDEGAPLRYTGAHHISLAENSGKRPRILSFDLTGEDDFSLPDALAWNRPSRAFCAGNSLCRFRFRCDL